MSVTVGHQRVNSTNQIALSRARCGKRWGRRWERRSGRSTLLFSAATSGSLMPRRASTPPCGTWWLWRPWRPWNVAASVCAMCGTHALLSPVPVLSRLLRRWYLPDFWARLASFASLGIAPPDWHSVPPGHPFLCCVSDRIVMNGPPDVASPPGSPVS